MERPDIFVAIDVGTTFTGECLSIRPYHGGGTPRTQT